MASAFPKRDRLLIRVRRRLNIRCRNSVNPPWHGSNSAVALRLMMPSFVVSIERQKLMRTFVKRSFVKLSLVKLCLAGAVGACALGSVGLNGASAADMPMPQARDATASARLLRSAASRLRLSATAGRVRSAACWLRVSAPRYVGPYWYGRGPYWRGYGPRYGYRYARRYYWR